MPVPRPLKPSPNPLNMFVIPSINPLIGLKSPARNPVLKISVIVTSLKSDRIAAPNVSITGDNFSFTIAYTSFTLLHASIKNSRILRAFSVIGSMLKPESGSPVFNALAAFLTCSTKDGNESTALSLSSTTRSASHLKSSPI